MSSWIIFALFFISAFFTFFIAPRLAIFGDAVKEKTRASSAFIGALIGMAISLPELTSSVTAIIIDSPDLAVGNLIGSNLFNIMGLAIFDMVYRHYQILTHATVESKLYGWLVIFMTLIILAGLSLTLPTHIFHISYTSIAIILLYFIGSKFINDRTEYKGRKAAKQHERYTDYSYTQVLWRFILNAVLIMMIGSVLTVTAERISVITGIGASFIGTFLVSVSTSLPDAVSVGTALKLRNFNLGISSLLGSNAFNLMIIAITDFIYLRGNLLQESSPVNMVTGVTSIMFILLIIYSMKRRKVRAWSYLIPSVLIMASYFITTYIAFQMK
ncbi:cation:H+ antiporter [Halobacillus karajensis]|uniref:Calcium/sodium:proton antiporter n=1 Tax=Halobacillus karajensis TaxID=195088 RepID=A0A024PAP6_9BACI|nr:sodium:calcium antiporter [Halobacillus karajensis]CDQ21573.1 putative calcium/sodium:proton antiporter [Halobacillus karajensis]CDQ25507.1 putative calcium/sodium:proton antiporter [Halobacillus karajensis]CDQ28962.1 putative calcium/sodium:proton antiporter [Halobacillus karajensis]SEI08842.1 cation:H+ antiporter [Halobacillus karajensis]